MVYDMLKATKGKFTGDEAMKFFVALEDGCEPARPDLDRSQHARHRPEHLHPQDRDEGRQARQCRIRHDPERQGSVERTEPAEVRWLAGMGNEREHHPLRRSRRHRHRRRQRARPLPRARPCGARRQGGRQRCGRHGRRHRGTGIGGGERVVAEIEAAGGTAIADTADVTDPAQVAAMVERAARALGPDRHSRQQCRHLARQKLRQAGRLRISAPCSRCI